MQTEFSDEFFAGVLRDNIYSIFRIETERNASLAEIFLPVILLQSEDISSSPSLDGGLSRHWM